MVRLFDSLKFRYKLFLSFSIVLSLFLFTAVLVFFSSRKTRELAFRVEMEVYPAHQLAQQLKADYKYIGELYSSAIMFKNADKIDKAGKAAPDFNDKITKLENSAAIEPSKTKEMAGAFRSYLDLADRSARAMVGGIDFMAMASDLARLGEITRQLNVSLDDLGQVLRQDLSAKLGVIGQMASRTTALVAATALLVLMLCVAVTFFVTGRITKPIFALTAAMEKVKGGDLTAEIAVSGSDEIAVLGLHFNTMVAGLKERNFIRDTFKRYVAHSIVDEVLKNPERLQLGGELRVMTAMFADLAGFTTISEKLLPTQLVAILNEYFEEMVGIILEHKGTFDKFEGDLMMAFWGAPLHMDDHAVHACYAALEMQGRLRALRPQWKDRGMPHLVNRIGLNSGEMLVGNLGSRSIMSYTVMGDEVNLASRLESGGKNYGVHLVISELTHGLAKAHIEVRELDIVQVKGKEQPIKIYELLAKRDDLPEARKILVSQFNAGLAYYRGLRWEDAAAAFEKCLALDSNDAPSKIYRDRCLEFQKTPPPPEWNGVHVFTEK